jgi:hypothetical protein
MKHTSSIIPEILSAIIAIIIAIISPAIIFWAGYFGGWILMNLVGERISDGLNLLFNTTRFTRELIPLTCGILTVVGGYFKSTSLESKNKGE